MALFLSSRFVCTALLRHVSTGKLLMTLAVAAGALMLGCIFLQNHAGLLCLIAVSGCMSPMFPTIYGIALAGMGEDAKLGSAGLVFAIVGGPHSLPSMRPTPPIPYCNEVKWLSCHSTPCWTRRH